jgi:ABC-type dipeptide/oligopeptide/nickel transport system permease component
MKSKSFAFAGLMWIIFVFALSLTLPTCIYDPDCGQFSWESFLLALNIYFVPGYILFLVALKKSKRGMFGFKYGRKSSH